MKFPFRASLIAAGLALAASAQAVTPSFSVSDIPALSPDDRQMTASQRATERFTQSHYKRFQFDDAFSAHTFDRYLEVLDYNRNVLTQADVDRYSKYRFEMDDMLADGEVKPAFDIFNEVMRKRYQRYQYALSLLDTPMTFTNDDEMVIDRSKMAWPKDEVELNAIWYNRVKFDALNLAMAGKKWPEIKEILTKRYNNAIRMLTQTNSDDAFQLLMNAFAREIDPHTSYLSPISAEQFQTEMSLELEGIGAVLQMKDDYTVIVSLVAGGPAAKSKKLKKGDRIVAVAQEGEAPVDVIGWRLDEIVSLIKGPKGTKVTLNIQPEDASAEGYKLTLVRDKIRLEDKAVKTEYLEMDQGTVAVLVIPSFYDGLTKDVKKQLRAIEAKGVKGVVVDLRNNGGGLLTEAVSLSGLFISYGPVVQVRDSYGRIRAKADIDKRIQYAGPLTVLINRYSASASEIFAAAMQDYGRGLIVGEQSFGKGTVQQHAALDEKFDRFEKSVGYIQMTIQKFYRVNGGSTQHLGVVPDISFPAAMDPNETGESMEDNALPWDSIKKARYTAGPGFEALLPQLKAKHQARMKDDREWGFIFDDIETYQKEKDINTISLNQSKREAEQSANKVERLARINERQKAEHKKPFKTLDDVPDDYDVPDPYLDEAAEITLDLAAKDAASTN
ncbi:Tail-specific protease [Vibrio stylophorae]|uniref:Tail-specific protease n=1 Tax=Vibrio stylophorae TaxID=659351 RepID=A0ABM8ZT49_9VIBR|nr:carboxy terminal-processing peptidase [Vibrio stylophorae]CAH0533467.1 Tail-specific protease [Vibrio stylophorae]